VCLRTEDVEEEEADDRTTTTRNGEEKNGKRNYIKNRPSGRLTAK